MSVAVGPLAPGVKLALAGRVVSMDAASRVIDDGAVYVEGGAIVAVQPKSQAAPAGFAQVDLVPTRGTLYPGLIELHNHIAYNILPLWKVPQRFETRDQWGDHPDKRRLVTAPMTVVGRTPELMPAVVRWVECKCLLGGTTTTQGLKLFSSAGSEKFYRGLVRNVEHTADPALRPAGAKIPDVRPDEAKDFLETLKKHRAYLLHLSEGQGDRARRHFLDLQLAEGQWALTPAFIGIHAAALEAADFQVLRTHGASVVWSPLSNLLLYGGTMKIGAAHAAGVRFGLGSDWSVSGSKNLLGELKVARLVNRHEGSPFSDADLVAMVTRNPAAMLGWDTAVGSLEEGKRADLIVVAGQAGDPYAALLEARETDLRLVMIDGVPRYGLPGLLSALGVTEGETVTVGGRARRLYLAEAAADPTVEKIALATAKKRLARALKHLPELAAEVDAQPRGVLPAGPRGEEQWFLQLDELAAPTAARPTLLGALELFAVPLATVVGPMTLDPITAVDDAGLGAALAAEANLPEFVRNDLPGLLQ